MMKTNPHGWAKKRARAERRSRARSQADRDAIRAERARLYAAQAAGARETARKPKEEENSTPESRDGLESMSWEQMADEMRAAGKFVPPKIGEAKLREKLRGVRDEKAAQAD